MAAGAGLRTEAPWVEMERRGRKRKKGRRKAEECIIGRDGRKHAVKLLATPSASSCTVSPTSKLARDVQDVHEFPNRDSVFPMEEEETTVRVKQEINF